MREMPAGKYADLKKTLEEETKLEKRLELANNDAKSISNKIVDSFKDRPEAQRILSEILNLPIPNSEEENEKEEKNSAFYSLEDTAWMKKIFQYI